MVMWCTAETWKFTKATGAVPSEGPGARNGAAVGAGARSEKRALLAFTVDSSGAFLFNVLVKQLGELIFAGHANCRFHYFATLEQQ